MGCSISPPLAQPLNLFEEPCCAGWHMANVRLVVIKMFDLSLKFRDRPIGPFKAINV